MKALITGVSGFVGSHLARYLLEHTDWQIAGTVYGSDRNIADLGGALELYPAELSHLPVVEYILDRARPDVVYHLAAMAVTSKSWRDPAATLHVNLAMQANVLQAVVNLGLKCRMLVVGSSEEYGAVAAHDLPVDEETPLRPMNPYAVSKIGQDMLGLQYYLSHGLDTVRVRPFNHIGPRQGLGFVTSDFASQVARIEAGRQEPVMRVGNLDAERDFTDVRDVVRAYHLLTLHGAPGEVYNVGSGASHAIREVLDALLASSRAKIEVEADPARMRPSDVPRVVCDYGKLRACTGWKPRFTFAESLADVLAYWRAEVGREEEG
ncbi:MAG: GDP-mannose 4,6-dehydratase [Anaerolineae bacterium]|nr:GDP-mannose 4,6-dehydratase [Anaerolineae bacterium]